MSTRYAVISSDGHAGAELYEYRDYLASQWHDDFDAWAPTYVNPFADLQAPTAYRSWDSARRLEETEARRHRGRGPVPQHGPALLRARGTWSPSRPRPRTTPAAGPACRPTTGGRSTSAPPRPGRRAAVVQVFVNDIDDAVAEVRWARETFPLLAGVLLPSVPPNSGLPGLWEPHYDPLWRVCEELEVPIQVHGGGGLPDYGDHEAARAMHAHRAARGSPTGRSGTSSSRGVLERFPTLQVVLTEQGAAWLPRGLETLDWFYRRMTLPEAAESVYFGAVAAGLSMTPTEYFHRNFWLGASFLRPQRVAAAPRDRCGPDHVGRRLPAQRGQLRLHDRGPPGRVRRRPRRRGPGA